MSDFADFDFSAGHARFSLSDYKEAVSALLRTYPGEIVAKPDVGFPVLEKIGDRVRSRSGLDYADVMGITETTILAFVPGIAVAGVEPEMTAQGEVNAIDIGFTLVDSGEYGKLRVEIAT